VDIKNLNVSLFMAASIRVFAALVVFLEREALQKHHKKLLFSKPLAWILFT
jgi:hypothetical protein